MCVLLKESNKAIVTEVMTLFGRHKAVQCLLKTLKIEREGGLLCTDHSRRRTPGGVVRGAPKPHVHVVLTLQDHAVHSTFESCVFLLVVMIQRDHSPCVLCWVYAGGMVRSF